ncbi:ABC transporter permease subunit [Caldicoprobacter algeriensis]|uniref:ABC transporter permease n=1 Tax=Caldicoprobacter algeriensis TaxID=699281 RepID=UPI0030B865B5|nr:ABC transporter permease subunit [Caldicoprobacter algeriensis]
MNLAPNIAVKNTGVKQRKRKFIAYMSQHYLLYIFLILPMAYFFIFKYIPMYGLLIAFKDYNVFQGIWGSPWNNFATFKEIFGMKDFYRAVRNTLLLNALDLIAGFPAPIILAIMLSELKNKTYKKISQTILYLPHFLSWIVIGGIVIQLFSTQTGLINVLLKKMGMGPVEFLSKKNNWLLVYVASGVWQSAGWNAIIYLAAIAGINPELYEAATVDGAGRLRKIWHVTLPCIKPTIIILLILNVGRIAQIGFDRPYAMGNYFVTEVSDVISTFVYRVGLRSGRFSTATAVGFFQSVVGMVFLLTANYIAEKFGEQGIW